MTFMAELKRRKVFRVAAVYAATGYVVLEAADLILPRLGVPDWAMSLLVGIVLLGFPLALVMAWALELTPEGRVRSQTPATASGAAPDAAAAARQPLFGARTLIVTGLLVALGVGLSAGWFLKPDAASAPEPAEISADGSASSTAADPAATRPSVAVLPFDNLSADPEQGYFADGLTEEILNALAALPNLLVTARTSSFFYKDKDVPVDEIGERLGVDHVLEGSVRRSGDEMRVTAQLVRARDGFHLWSETYDRGVNDAFTVQSDIATEVASALGILLDEQQRARMEAAGVRDPEAYALFAKGFEIYALAHGGAPQVPTLVRANEWFDRAFARAPDLWVARYHSADLYSHILLELAAGVDDPGGLPADEVRRSRDEHERRLLEAARAAPSQASRDFIEITRRLFSDDWTGLAALARRTYGHTVACGYDQWMQVPGPAFGMAEPARDFFLRSTRCNALDESNWLHAANASIYLGDAVRALEIADRGLAIADIEGYGLQEGRLISLLALGRFDEARASLSSLSGSLNTNRLLGEAWIAAARSDRDALDELREQMTDAQPGIAKSLILAARAGDRADANAQAAAIDARPAGPVYLMAAAYYCLCGAPFDLDATPNLAARLEEAGLTWPPTDPIDWPLKDW